MKINPKLLLTLQSKNIALDFLKKEQNEGKIVSKVTESKIKIRPVSNTLSLTQSTNLFRLDI